MTEMPSFSSQASQLTQSKRLLSQRINCKKLIGPTSIVNAEADSCECTMPGIGNIIKKIQAESVLYVIYDATKGEAMQLANG